MTARKSAAITVTNKALTAYLDGALTPAERRRFERLLASDEGLRASLEEQLKKHDIYYGFELALYNLQEEQMDEGTKITVITSYSIHYTKLYESAS